MTAELVRLRRRQNAARTQQRFLRVGRRGPIEHVAPRISVLPQLHVLREQTEGAPGHSHEERPAKTAAGNQVDERQAATHRRPGDESVAEPRDHFGFTTRCEISLRIFFWCWPGCAPPLRPPTSRRPRRWFPEARLRTRQRADARTPRWAVRRCTPRFQSAPPRVSGRPPGFGLFLARAHYAPRQIRGGGRCLVLEVGCLFGDLFEQQSRNGGCRERQLS